MTDATTWEALRQLRLGGRKPSLPVIVTTQASLPQRLEGVGCMTILHERGTPFPVVLLEGLDVICFFDACYDSMKVWELCKRKERMPASLRSWCTCFKDLTSVPMACAQAQDFAQWLEGGSVDQHKGTGT